MSSTNKRKLRSRSTKSSNERVEEDDDTTTTQVEEEGKAELEDLAAAIDSNVMTAAQQKLAEMEAKRIKAGASVDKQYGRAIAMQAPIIQVVPKLASSSNSKYTTKQYIPSSCLVFGKGGKISAKMDMPPPALKRYFDEMKDDVTGEPDGEFWWLKQTVGCPITKAFLESPIDQYEKYFESSSALDIVGRLLIDPDGKHRNGRPYTCQELISVYALQIMLEVVEYKVFNSPLVKSSAADDFLVDVMTGLRLETKPYIKAKSKTAEPKAKKDCVFGGGGPLRLPISRVTVIVHHNMDHPRWAGMSTKGHPVTVSSREINSKLEPFVKYLNLICNLPLFLRSQRFVLGTRKQPADKSESEWMKVLGTEWQTWCVQLSYVYVRWIRYCLLATRQAYEYIGTRKQPHT